MRRGKLGRKGSAEGDSFAAGEAEELTGRVLGAAIAVHRELGPGFVESVYQRALQLEMRARGVAFASEVECEIHYRGMVVGRHRFDLVVEGGVLVELKDVQSLDAAHFAQVRSYLEAGQFRVGLLLNFSASTLVIRRVEPRRRTHQQTSAFPVLPCFPRPLALPQERAAALRLPDDGWPDSTRYRGS